MKKTLLLAVTIWMVFSLSACSNVIAPWFTLEYDCKDGMYIGKP